MDWVDVLRKQPSEIITLDGYLYARTRDGVFRTKMPVTADRNIISDGASHGTKKREKQFSLSERMRMELRGKYGPLGLARLEAIKNQVYEAADVRHLQSSDGFGVLLGRLKGLHQDQIDYINFMGGLTSRIEQSIYEMKDTPTRLATLHWADAQIGEFAGRLSPAERKACEDYLGELNTCLMLIRNNPKDDPDLKWLSH